MYNKGCKLEPFIATTFTYSQRKKGKGRQAPRVVVNSFYGCGYRQTDSLYLGIVNITFFPSLPKMYIPSLLTTAGQLSPEIVTSDPSTGRQSSMYRAARTIECYHLHKIIYTYIRCIYLHMFCIIYMRYKCTHAAYFPAC